MNINEPRISRELALLMKTKKMTPVQQTQFIRAARKSKGMEEFKKDFTSGSIYNEPIPSLFED